MIVVVRYCVPNVNKSTESADGDCYLKFYTPLELIGIYTEIKKKKKKKKKKNICITSFSVPDNPFSVEMVLFGF